MKKEYYEKPETEVNEFKIVDVISTSGEEPTTNPGDDNDTTFPW